MKRLAFCSAALAVMLLLLAGCVSTPAGVSITSRTPKDTTDSGGAWQPKQAWIFIEGVQQVSTPATVTVRRSFNISNVSLHIGPDFEEVRRYDIEWAVTGSRSALDFSFSGSIDGGYATFNVQELPKDKKGTYIIPYYAFPVQIIDHEYDLEIIVRE